MAKRQTEDPAEFMRKRMGHQNDNDRTNGPSGHSDPMTPGASGKEDPKPSSPGRDNGSNFTNEKQPPQGQRTPASKARGSGKKQGKTLPSNGKSAGSMVKGRNKSVPSRESIGRRLEQSMGKPQGNPREGILSHFEGFRGGGK